MTGDVLKLNPARKPPVGFDPPIRSLAGIEEKELSHPDVPTSVTVPHSEPKHLLIYPSDERTPLCSFEAFAEAVSDWPGMFFELDGSFVWVPANSPVGRQQIDGMVYDRNGRIEYLELKGTASVENWWKLIAPLGSQKIREPLSGLNTEANLSIALSAILPVKIYDVGLGEFRSAAEVFAND